MIEMLAKATMVIILLYISVSNQYIIPFKLIWCYTSIYFNKGGSNATKCNITELQNVYKWHYTLINPYCIFFMKYIAIKQNHKNLQENKHKTDGGS